MNLLLVDDEPLLLENMKFILSHLAEKIFTAKNGKEALQILSQEDIRCVITDLTMPVMSGLELIRVVRQKEINTEFIVYSAYLNDDVITEFQKLGVNEFLRKPDFLNIENVVSEVLQSNKKGNEGVA